MQRLAHQCAQHQQVECAGQEVGRLLHVWRPLDRRWEWCRTPKRKSSPIDRRWVVLAGGNRTARKETGEQCDLRARYLPRGQDSLLHLSLVVVVTLRTTSLPLSLAGMPLVIHSGSAVPLSLASKNCCMRMAQSFWLARPEMPCSS